MALKLAKINMSKRKEAIDIAVKVFDALDPSGENGKKYKKLLTSMSDAEFSSFMNRLWEDDAMNFILDIVDHEREVTLENVEKAAKIIGVPLEEYVIFPDGNGDDEYPTVTKTKIITMYIIFKRLQQTTQKKNSTSIHISDRSAITRQVTGDDKNGRSSDVENNALVTIGMLNSLREFNGFRADGLERKNYAYSQITNTGQVSLHDVEAQAGIGDRTMLNTIDVLYLGMGIKTDLVDESLILNKTAKNI